MDRMNFNHYKIKKVKKYNGYAEFEHEFINEFWGIIQKTSTMNTGEDFQDIFIDTYLILVKNDFDIGIGDVLVSSATNEKYTVVNIAKANNRYVIRCERKWQI